MIEVDLDFATHTCCDDCGEVYKSVFTCPVCQETVTWCGDVYEYYPQYGDEDIAEDCCDDCKTVFYCNRKIDRYKWYIKMISSDIISNLRQIGKTETQTSHIQFYLKQLMETEQNKQLDLNSWVKKIYEHNLEAGWYTDLETGLRKERNVGEMIALIHSEVSEALEGKRKELKDDKLPHREMCEVELADTFIRISDLCGYLGYDLAGAVAEKFEYNKSRSDHKLENRKKEGGKKI